MITINIDKAKNIAHDIRRAEREVEFTPLDKKAIIPMYAAEAEAARQEVRDKYAAIQVQIDEAANMDTLHGIVSTLRPNNAV
jgi:hypothetical protein